MWEESVQSWFWISVEEKNNISADGQMDNSKSQAVSPTFNRSLILLIGNSFFRTYKKGRQPEKHPVQMTQGRWGCLEKQPSCYVNYFSVTSTALNRIYKVAKPLKSKGAQDYTFYIRIYLFAFSLAASPHPLYVKLLMSWNHGDFFFCLFIKWWAENNLWGWITLKSKWQKCKGKHQPF